MKKTMIIILGGGFMISLFASLGELNRTNLNNAATIFLVTFGTWSLLIGGWIIAIRLYTQPKLETGENILKSEWGSCDFGNGRIGGFLYLTKSRLIFKSHFLANRKGYESSTILQDIAYMKKNGQNLIIETELGQTMYFLLNDTNGWMDNINKSKIN